MSNDYIQTFESFCSERRYRSQSEQRIMDNIRNYLKGNENSNECLTFLLDEYVRSSKGDKSASAGIIREFYNYYKRQHPGFKIDTELDTIVLMDTPVLRQLEILKYLHEKHTMKEVAQHFGMSAAAIRRDVDKLRNGIGFMGTRIRIEESKDPNHPLSKYYESTAHPLFLTLNMTEVYLLLSALVFAENKNEIVKGACHKNPYARIADAIYSQLSDYGKRIINRAFADEKNFSDRKENSFLDERQAVTGENSTTTDIVGYMLKSGDTADSVDFVDNEGMLRHMDNVTIGFDFGKGLHEWCILKDSYNNVERIHMSQIRSVCIKVNYGKNDQRV